MKTKIDFVGFIHRIVFGGVSKKGGLDILIDHFINDGKTALLIEFPLSPSQRDEIVVATYSSKGRKVLHQFRLPLKSNVFLWVLEPIICTFYVLRYALFSKVVMTSDPLTSFPAVFLRKMGLLKKHYYHFIDYSETRFDNKLLDFIYLKLMLFGVGHADLVGCVTKRIKDILESEVPFSRCVHIPNSFDFSSLDECRLPFDKRTKYSLVTSVSYVSEKYLVKELVATVKALKKEYPKVTLTVIGDITSFPKYVSSLQRYISKNNLKDNIIFTGFIPKDLNLGYVSKAHISLAFYNPLYSHVNYGDSLKIRESVTLGVPVVADDVTSTAEEMVENEAGILIPKMRLLEESIRKVFNDDLLCEKLSRNALDWAKKTDKKKMISKYLDFFND